MKSMNLLLTAAMLFTATSAFAEYNETYCGKLVYGKGFQTEDGETPSAVLITNYAVFRDQYSNKKGQTFAFVALTSLSPKAEEKLPKFLKSRKVAEVCVSGTWSGHLQPSPITYIPVHSTDVEDIFYAQ